MPDGADVVIELGQVRPDRSDVMIELGPVGSGPAEAEDPPASERARRWTLRRSRPLALAVTAVLALAAGGAAPPAAPDLVEIAAIPLGAAPNYLLTEDRLFVSSLRAGSAERAISGYDLRTGRQLWTRRQPLESDDRAAVRAAEIGVFGLTGAAGLLLITAVGGAPGPAGVRTDALDERTGELRWSVPYPVDVLAGGRLGLVIEESYPAGSLIVAGDPRPVPEQVYYSQSGGAYRAPPDGVRALVLDMATGQMRWTSPLSSNIEQIPGAEPMLLIQRSPSSIEIREAASGQLRRQFSGTVLGTSVAARANGLLLVQSGRQVTAYATRDWHPVWQRTLTDPEDYLYDCGQLICQSGPGGNHLLDAATGRMLAGPGGEVRALDPTSSSTPGGVSRLVDPATGAVVWSMGQARFGWRAGHLVETTEDHRPVRTVDPRTGRTLVELGDWQGFSGTPDERVALLTRNAPGVTWFALLRPGATMIDLLGAAPYPTTLCQPGGTRLIACQAVDGMVRVWRHR